MIGGVVFDWHMTYQSFVRIFFVRALFDDSTRAHMYLDYAVGTLKVRPYV